MIQTNTTSVQSIHKFSCNGVVYDGAISDDDWCIIAAQAGLDEQGHVKLTKAVMKQVSKNVQCCAYDATKDYIEAMLGGKLNADDRDWYKSHPQTTAAGLPMEVAATVLNDLVAPYGIGVSEIFLPRGSVLCRDWAPVLGINMLAAVDESTTNEEYLAVFPNDTAPYNLHYVDEAPSGAVVMYGDSGQHAIGGGHAKFVAPRGYAGKFLIAVKFDRISNCVRLATPPTFGDDRMVHMELDVFGSEVDGKKVRSLLPTPAPVYQNYGLHQSNLNGFSATSSTSSGTAVPWEKMQERFSDSIPTYIGVKSCVTLADAILERTDWCEHSKRYTDSEMLTILLYIGYEINALWDSDKIKTKMALERARLAVAYAFTKCQDNIDPLWTNARDFYDWDIRKMLEEIKLAKSRYPVSGYFRLLTVFLFLRKMPDLKAIIRDHRVTEKSELADLAHRFGTKRSPAYYDVIGGQWLMRVMSASAGAETPARLRAAAQDRPIGLDEDAVRDEFNRRYREDQRHWGYGG